MINFNGKLFRPICNTENRKTSCKIILSFASIILLSLSAYCQTEKSSNKQEIKQVLQTFMECLVKKDSIKFYSLFHTDPVVWVGVSHHKSYADELKKDATAKNYFSSNYKSFYKHFYTKDIEEKFSNIQILENGYIATVLFDYSFWEKGKKTNWGKENWAMIRTNGQWKITSVLFSSEDEAINPEPKRKK